MEKVNLEMDYDLSTPEAQKNPVLTELTKDEQGVAEAKNEEPAEVKTDELVLPYTLTLKYPIAVGKSGDCLTEITIRRRPTARDVEDMPVSDHLRAKHVIDLTGRLSGISPTVLFKMDLADFTSLQGVISSFL